MLPLSFFHQAVQSCHRHSEKENASCIALNLVDILEVVWPAADTGEQKDPSRKIRHDMSRETVCVVRRAQHKKETTM
jgi:hypothetical protein